MAANPRPLRLAALVPPRLPHGCMSRDALVQEARRALDGSVLEIVAGAGFGKTTLLIQALEHSARPAAWLSCDADLGDHGTFFAAVAGSFARIAPGFGATLRPEGPAPSQANALGNEAMDILAGETVLALDDVHLLGSDAGRLLALLRAALPDHVHLAVTSRDEIGGDWLRVSAKGARIGTGELRLGAAEALALIGPAVPSETTQLWLRQTEGWITGLLLAARAHGAGSDGGPRTASSNYLVQEVLADLPEQTVRFLEDTSVLERFTPALASAVAGGSQDAGAICELLASRHFTSRSSEGDWFRHHHLLREALEKRLAADAERLRTAHRRAGDAWASIGDVLNAARHLRAAGDTDAAAAVLAPTAEIIGMGSDAAALLGLIDGMPPHVVDDHPGLLLGGALARLQTGDLPRALKELPATLARLLEMGEGARAAMALHRLFLAQDLAGVPHEECIRTGERFIPGLPADAPMLPGCLIFLASRYGFACNPARADEALQVAMLHPAATAMPVIGAYAAVVRAHYVTRLRGDHPAAFNELRKGIDFLERHEEQDLFGLLPWAWGFEAIDKNWVGRHEEALIALDRVELWARRKGLGRSMAPAVTWSRALALVGLGRWEEADSEIHLGASLDAVAAAAGGLWATYRTAPAAALAAHRGDAGGLRTAIEAGMAGMSAQGVRFEHPMLLCDLATAAAVGGLPETAARLAHDATARARRSGVPWAVARAGLTQAAVAPDTPDALSALDEALRVTVAHPGFEELWTLRERPRAAALLATAIERRLGPGGAAATLACLGDASLAEETFDALAASSKAARIELKEALARSDHSDVARVDGSGTLDGPLQKHGDTDPDHRPPLRFGALGGFSVHRGDAEVPLSAFGRERSRALLAALLCSDRPLHRDQLLEWFWPDLPPDRGQRAFHVALHGARRAIEPGRARRALSVVQVASETYRISLDAGDSFDVDEFLIASRTSDRDGLMRAEALHRGEPFPEWRYEEWAQALRNRVQEARARVLERLGTLLLEDGEPREASKRFRELLESDPEREEWHRALMRCFWAAGEVGLALRQYQACRKVLVTRLGTEPSPETRGLYTRILREDEPLG